MRIADILQAEEGAKRILEATMKKGEKLAIIGSTDVDPSYYEMIMQVAKNMGIEATLGLMEPRTTYGKPAPTPLEAQAAAADLAFLTASTSLAHTSTALNTLKAGKRAITFPVPPGPGRAFDNLKDQAIYDMSKLEEIKRISIKLSQVLDKADNVVVKSPLGTNLTVSIKGRKCHNWYGFFDDFVHNYTAYPPGDCHLSAVEDTANGTAVCDGFIGGMGIPSEPLRFEFKNGKLIDFKGKDAYKLKKILDASDENARVFAEVGFGTNPWQGAINSNGDKYILGSFHFAIGGSATPCFGGVHFDGKNKSNLHLDCLMYAPVRVEADGIVLIDDGKVTV